MTKKISERINWVECQIIKTFILTRIELNFPLLEEWWNVKKDFSSFEINELEKLSLKLKRNVSRWNDETLKMKFISPILIIVDYDTNEFKGIFDADLKGVVQNHNLFVVANYALAKFFL